MNTDVKKPDGSGLTGKFILAAEHTEPRVSELIDFQGNMDMDRIMGSLEAGRMLGHCEP